MKMMKKLFVVLFLTSLAASTYANQNLSLGTHVAQKNNVAGIEWKNLGPSKDRFCFLSRVRIEDTDDVGEVAECLITLGGTQGNEVWFLGAILTQNADADVWCSAWCFTR
jgi:hypothetical protein